MERVAAAAKRFEDYFFVILGEASEGMEELQNLRFVGRRWDMRPFYSLCDFLVCRAGASTLAEIIAWKIPALAVPWKDSADGHQARNARNFSALTGNPVWSDDGTNGFEEALAELFNRERPSFDLNFGREAAPLLWVEGMKRLRRIKRVADKLNETPE